MAKFEELVPTHRLKSKVGILVGAAHTILRCDLKMRRISARWIPHLVTKEQKLARVRIAEQLLKQFPKYNNQSFANIITGDEPWVHFYESKPKKQNKIRATKGSKRPCIAKRTMSIKKVMYVIFFSSCYRVLARNFKTCVRDSLLGANWRPKMKNMRTGYEVLEYDESSRAPDRGSFCVFDAKKMGKNSSSLKPMRHENAD